MPGDPLCVAMVVSDHAIKEEGTRKLSLIGVFSGFNASRFPFQAPRFVVSASLANFEGHPAPIDVTVRVEEPSTAHVLRSGHGRVTFDTQGPGFEPCMTVDIVIAMPGVIFPHAGLYDVVLLVNTFEAARRHLFVRSVTSTPQVEG